MAQDVFGDIFARRGGPEAAATGSPVTAPTGPGPGAAPVQTPGPAGPQDPLTKSLADVNSNLQAVASGQIQMTPEAENELKVTISLLTSLAQSAQGQQPTAPGGPALSQAGPGGSQPASAPPGVPV